jgi:hypothetical protein
MTGFTLRLLLAGALSALTFVGALAIGVSEVAPPAKPLPVRTQDAAEVSRALAAAVASILNIQPADTLPLELAAYADAKRQALTQTDAARRAAALGEADRRLAILAGKDVTMDQVDKVDRILGLSLLQ